MSVDCSDLGVLVCSQTKISVSTFLSSILRFLPFRFPPMVLPSNCTRSSERDLFDSLFPPSRLPASESCVRERKAYVNKFSEMKKVWYVGENQPRQPRSSHQDERFSSFFL